MNRFSHLRWLILLIGLGVAGCSTRTGTISKEPLAYIRLVGVGESDAAQIDDLAPAHLSPEKRQASVAVAPGKRRVRVLRGGVVVVDRTVLVSDLQTLEIKVP